MRYELKIIIRIAVPALNVDHALSICISIIGRMRWSQMDGRLVKWQFDVVREDASRQARHQLAHLVLVGGVNYIVVDDDIVAEKVGRLRHVLVETTDHGSQMNHLSWFVLFKELFDLFPVAIYSEVLL